MKQNPIVIGSSRGAIASGVVATATTFCCVGPAAIAIIGTGGIPAAARLAPCRPYFIIGSVLLLAFGWPVFLRAGASERHVPHKRAGRVLNRSPS